MRTSATADPFGTESIRARVLDTWRASPARFREDANAEQDYALGGYRDRAIVELLQNASDAALGGDRPGRVVIQLTPEELLVSNTGAELTPDGVASLASLRASAKRESSGSVGRFGVGFAAVLGVSDEPVIASISGAVRFSLSRTRALVEAEHALSDELSRRDGELPILRLPFAAERVPVEGFVTTVALRLLPGALQRVQAMLDQVDALTLLSLPGIGELTVEVEGERRVLSVTRWGSEVEIAEDESKTHWHLRDVLVDTPYELRSSLPVEERDRTQYRITWALPHDASTRAGEPAASGRIHAPTITDETLKLPVALIADFPLDATRRHIKPGAVTQHLLRRAASEYANLVVERVAIEGVDALGLIPEPGFFGEVDAELRSEIRDELARRPLLRSATNPERFLTGSQAIVVKSSNHELVAALATQIPDVVDPTWSSARDALQLVGPRELTVADALDMLIEVRESPGWWNTLYSALDGEDPATLTGLPVLLADGSLTRDIRSAIDTTSGGMDAPGSVSSIEPLGLKAIHPGAAHPLLHRLGATSGEAELLLGHAALQQRLSHAHEDHELLELAQAVLTLVEHLPPEAEPPRLGNLKLPCVDGEFRAASESVVPDSPLSRMVASDEVLVDVRRLGQPSSKSLVLVGALAALRVVRHFDVSFDPDSLANLAADGDAWHHDMADLLSQTVADGADVASLGGFIDELAVVAGIELIADEAWPEHLSVLMEPAIRRAIVTPTELVVDGRRHRVPSPAAWWLREAPLFPMAATEVRVSGDDRLAGLLPEVDAQGLSDDLLAAIGVRRRLEDWFAEPHGPSEVLERLADEDALVDAVSLAAIYRALAGIDVARLPDPPRRIRVPDSEGTEVVDASGVTVVCCPHHRPLIAEPVLLGPNALADVLDVSASTTVLADADVSSTGVIRRVPEAALDLLSSAPDAYFEHDELLVEGIDVPWWVDPDGAVHAATTDGLARGLAWSSGQWDLRWEISAILVEPELAEQAREERSFD